MMPAGKYYIGDLCYVMHSEWDECCALFFPKNHNNLHKATEGEFTLKDGRKFAAYNTMYGDGTYYSNINTRHCVDAGLIGCIRLEDIQDDSYDIKEIKRLGAIVEFGKPFDTDSSQGEICFGHVKINTGDEE